MVTIFFRVNILLNEKTEQFRFLILKLQVLNRIGIENSKITGLQEYVLDNNCDCRRVGLKSREILFYRA